MRWVLYHTHVRPIRGLPFDQPLATMLSMSLLFEKIVRWQSARVARGLRAADPRRLAAESAAGALRAFQQAARRVPAYRALLAERGVNPRDVAGPADFLTRVPVVDKETLFRKNDLRALLVDGAINDVRSFFSSSGSTGVFSFGAESWRDADRAAWEVEFILDDAFGALSKRTLLVNALGPGIHIPTRTLPTIETGSRLDIAWELIKKLRGEFERFIIVGEQLLLKKLVEDGAAAGVPWKDLVVHIVSGAEYIAENFRGYMGSLLGHDPDDRARGSVNISFGLSEIANSIAKETPETQTLRRLAMSDAGVRQKLYGQGTRLCGALLQYDPRAYFIETSAPGPRRGEMILTALDRRRKIPLIRYNTRDIVDLLPHDRLAELLSDIGRPDLLPPFKLPFLIVWGKNKGLDAGDGRTVYPEEIKEALYADPTVASRTTGYFFLERSREGVRLLLQLRPGSTADGELEEKLKAQLSVFTAVAIEIRFLDHGQFPHFPNQSFDRKAAYF
ncbi:MAG: hypothetical protein IPL30_01515 [Elusimicrobia bacterium]|nr:hypothetical protein [Elusimicrobiota bacterium]